MPQSTLLPEGHYATCPNGQKIHYLDEGEGPVVLFLHGSGPGASGHSNFKGNYPQWVKQGYRCLVPDLVGFGYSDKPQDVDYQLAFFVECVKQTLDAADVDRCAVVGNSLGGAVAIGLALDYPELVEQLILMAPGGMSEREEYLQMPGMQKMFEIYMSQGELNAENMRELFEFGLVYDPKYVTDELVAERSYIMSLMNPHVMMTMDIPYLPDRLPELKCPILVFWGANDNMMPDSGLLATAKKCPHMKMIVLSECGHWAMVEHEALFNRECIEFLQRGSSS
ncbi:MAG: alpha/beta fold hydrolase [Pseudomonadales bacterium]|nr:alpha/beta fold hydrolase [Pseudomonadales bacterium]MCP5189107.1 alpha/beta fold hydrolase [Pseudomonadales bacterium]